MVKSTHALVLGILIVMAGACTVPLSVHPGTPETLEAAPAPSTAESTRDLQEDDVANDLTPDEAATYARTDLAARLSLSPAEISVLEIRAVTWPDASLGCPKPDVAYAQVVRDGLFIRLQAGDQMVFYHSALGQLPFLCEETAQILPAPSRQPDEFVPPPDAEID